MKNYDSNFFSKNKYYNEYYQFNTISKTISLIEAECLETPTDTTNNPKSSIKGVMCALGVITTLIVGSTWQLYRCIKVIPANSKIIQSKELSRTFLSANQQNKLAISKMTDEIETLARKNAIAKGRF